MSVIMVTSDWEEEDRWSRSKRAGRRRARLRKLFPRPAQAGRVNSLERGLAGNATDIFAIDAEVVQFAVAHAAKLGHGFEVFEPVVERTGHAHFRSPVLASSSLLLIPIYAVALR